MRHIRTSAPVPAFALSLLCGACGASGADVTDGGDDASLPPPAAALSAEARVALPARLEQLASQLAAVLESDLDESGQETLLLAEAATDRLLEEEPERDWLATGYYVEARLRQIQALADRIVAELRRGVAHELVLEDIAALRLAVDDLREQLAVAGPRDAPPPLDSLLVASASDPRSGLGGGPATTASTDTTSTPSAAAEPTVAPEGGPLGEPIRP